VVLSILEKLVSQFFRKTNQEEKKNE